MDPKCMANFPKTFPRIGPKLPQHVFLRERDEIRCNHMITGASTWRAYNCLGREWITPNEGTGPSGFDDLL